MSAESHTSWITHDGHEVRTDGPEREEDPYSDLEELALEGHEISNVEAGSISHGLDKVDAALEQDGISYQITISEYGRQARVRATRENGKDVYTGRTSHVPFTEERIEDLLEGETLKRTY